MATAIFDNRFDITDADAANLVLRHEDGREWSQEEIDIVGKAIVGTTVHLKRIIAMMDVEIAQQQDILRGLRECNAILSASNQAARERAAAQQPTVFEVKR